MKMKKGLRVQEPKATAAAVRPHSYHQDQQQYKNQDHKRRGDEISTEFSTKTITSTARQPTKKTTTREIDKTRKTKDGP